MNIRLKQSLLSLWKNAKKEFSKTPIQSSGILVGIFVIVLPLLSIASLRAFALYVLELLFQPIIKISLLPLIIALIFLLATFYPLRKKNSNIKRYHFIPFGDFLWKIKRYKNNNFSVNETPYCHTHRVKLLEFEREFFCPICGSDKSTKITYQHQRVLLDAVNSIAEAQIDKHINLG